jgi:hypothetical protein
MPAWRAAELIATECAKMPLGSWQAWTKPVPLDSSTTFEPDPWPTALKVTRLLYA